MQGRFDQVQGRYDQILEGEMPGRKSIEADGWNGFGIATMGFILSLTALLLYISFIQRGRIEMLYFS